MFLVHFSFQFEVLKYSNGDYSEEHDKYFNSNWRIVYISETSESKSVDCNVFNGKWHTSCNVLKHEFYTLVTGDDDCWQQRIFLFILNSYIGIELLKCNSGLIFYY